MASVKDALNRLLQNSQLYDKHCFCFFIDGLDEFEPGVQDGLDYLDLVAILRQWAVRANGGLKVCVSSREEGVFMNEYAKDPSFRLQDLTRFDMQEYVRGRLSDFKNETLNETMRNKLVYAVPDKSSGMFLWTYLVVKTIRNKITHGVSDEALENHLKALPKGLEKLFQHVLDNLESYDRSWTLRTIRILQTAKSKDMQLTLLASSLLEEYEKDPEFSFREDIYLLQKDQETLRNQLRGACGGLIEHLSDHTPVGLDTLDFVHRSVPEMFQESKLRLQMEKALNGMDTVDALMHLSFAVIQIVQVGNSLMQMDKLCTIVLMLLTEKNDQPPYYFLESINTWIGKTWNNDPLLDTPGLTWHIEVDETSFHGVELTSHDYESRGCFYDTAMIATTTNRNDYIEWKIQHDSKTLRTPLRRAIVGWYLLRSKYWELFFRNDVFELNSTIPLLPTHSTNETQQPKDGTSFDSLTPWQFFLVSALLCEPNQWTFEAYVYTAQVIEEFFKQGTDPYCQVRITVRKNYETTLTVVFRKVESHHSWKLLDGGDTHFSGPLQWAIARCQELRGKPHLDFSTELREEYSLREIVKGSDWANRDAILELMDSYSGN